MYQVFGKGTATVVAVRKEIKSLAGSPAAGLGLVMDTVPTEIPTVAGAVPVGTKPSTTNGVEIPPVSLIRRPARLCSEFWSAEYAR